LLAFYLLKEIVTFPFAFVIERTIDALRSKNLVLIQLVTVLW
jgi:hypothetical protein